MKARFQGRCVECDMPIAIGQEIECGAGGGWSHVDCARKAKRALATVLELEAIMKEDHHIALGIFGIPSDCQGTFTRRQFLREATQRMDICEYDLALIRWYWRGLLDRDLSE